MVGDRARTVLVFFTANETRYSTPDPKPFTHSSQEKAIPEAVDARERERGRESETHTPDQQTGMDRGQRQRYRHSEASLFS